MKSTPTNEFPFTISRLSLVKANVERLNRKETSLSQTLRNERKRRTTVGNRGDESDDDENVTKAAKMVCLQGFGVLQWGPTSSRDHLGRKVTAATG